MRDSGIRQFSLPYGMVCYQSLRSEPVYRTSERALAAKRSSERVRDMTWKNGESNYPEEETKGMEEGSSSKASQMLVLGCPNITSLQGDFGADTGVNSAPPLWASAPEQQHPIHSKNLSHMRCVYNCKERWINIITSRATYFKEFF